MVSKKKKKLVAKKEQLREEENKQFREADSKQLKESENKQFRDAGNSWYPEFSTFREIHDSRRLVEVRKEELDAVGDNLGIFCAASGDIDSRSEVEVLENFCRGTSPTDVIAGKGSAGHQRIVWIDDRNSGSAMEESGDARQYKNPLTATGLFRALEEPRFDHKDLPDAARRLIYITDLSPACIHALVATVSWHQARALRDAISKHLTFQTSIAVKIPSAGITTFQLDLHLPFFILDKSTPPKESLEKFNTKPRRRWTDLSFLKLDTCESQDQEPKEVWGIQEAQISCVVVGFDNWRWVGYGFVDTEIDGVLDDSSDEDLSFDQIAAGKLEITTPIWSPRDYWIQVFEIRIEYIRTKWHCLIQKLEPSVDQYMKEHSPALSYCSGTGRRRAIQVKKDFDWALKIIDMLHRLDGVLSYTIESWKSFNSPDEDIGYFQDISVPARRSLLAVRSSFRELEGDQKRLALLKICCTNFSRALELHLHQEAKEAAVENGVTSEFTVAVLYPTALAAAIFSMQPGAIPFDLTPRSFALAVFILIVMVYAIRLVGRHVQPRWPLLQNPITWWLKKEKISERGEETLENELRDRV